MSYAPQVDDSIIRCRIRNTGLNWYNVAREIKETGHAKSLQLTLESPRGDVSVLSVFVTKVIIDPTSDSKSFIFERDGQKLLGRLEASSGWIEKL